MIPKLGNNPDEVFTRFKELCYSGHYCSGNGYNLCRRSVYARWKGEDYQWNHSDGIVKSHTCRHFYYILPTYVQDKFHNAFDLNHVSIIVTPVPWEVNYDLNKIYTPIVILHEGTGSWD